MSQRRLEVAVGERLLGLAQLASRPELSSKPVTAKAENRRGKQDDEHGAARMLPHFGPDRAPMPQRFFHAVAAAKTPVAHAPGSPKHYLYISLAAASPSTRSQYRSIAEPSNVCVLPGGHCPLKRPNCVLLPRPKIMQRSL